MQGVFTVLPGTHRTAMSKSKQSSARRSTEKNHLLREQQSAVMTAEHVSCLQTLFFVLSRVIDGAYLRGSQLHLQLCGVFLSLRSTVSCYDILLSPARNEETFFHIKKSKKYRLNKLYLHSSK